MKKRLILFHDEKREIAAWITEKNILVSECPQEYDMMAATNELSREMFGEELENLIEGARVMCQIQGRKL